MKYLYFLQADIKNKIELKIIFIGEYEMSNLIKQASDEMREII